MRMGLLASANSSALVGLSAASLVLGYGLLWVMWHYVFSPKRSHDDDLDKARRGEQ